MNKLNKVLLEQIELVKPNKDTIEDIDRISKKFIEDLRERLKNKKISADVFIGGSLAKKTLIKKSQYDVDIFVRFDKKYVNEKVSNLLGKVIGKSARRVHGSRDYYQIKLGEITLEIIPVLRIKKPSEAINVTDLSYFHVKYVLDKIKKNRKIADEIILAKSFCHAQNCYGAEGYIRGFSGYSLELLICYYKTFENFLKGVVKEGKEKKDRKDNKLVIDDSNFYKNKNVFSELNESKLISPIILIDPTFKDRNALAGLGEETFEKFKKISRHFLKNPSSEFFEKKDIFSEFKKKK